MTTNTETAPCLHCGKAAAHQLVCSGCGVVESTAEESDYFAIFSLPRRLTIDLADLEQRYYALSRRLHPDLCHDRPAAEQAVSLRMTALVNRAYRTLKDPVQRGVYWLQLHGESLGRDNERVSPALAARVFEVQEQLEALRAARAAGKAVAAVHEMEAIRADVRGDLQGCHERLTAVFDRTDATSNTPAGLAETKNILSELHYVRTLLRDVESELGPAWNPS